MGKKVDLDKPKEPIEINEDGLRKLLGKLCFSKRIMGSLCEDSQGFCLSGTKLYLAYGFPKPEDPYRINPGDTLHPLDNAYRPMDRYVYRPQSSPSNDS